MSKHTDDLSNQQFGKLTAISRIKGTQWLCQCECGETLKVGAYYLKKKAELPIVDVYMI